MRNNHERNEGALFLFCLPTTEPEFPFLKGVTLVALGGVSESMLTLSHASNRIDRRAPDKPKSPRAIGMCVGVFMDRAALR
jgi:hypothetical protein